MLFDAMTIWVFMDVMVYEFFGAIFWWELKVCGFFYGLEAHRLLLGLKKVQCSWKCSSTARYQFIAGCLVYCISYKAWHVSLLHIVSDKVRRVCFLRLVLQIGLVAFFLVKLNSFLLQIVLHYHLIVSEIPIGVHAFFWIPCIVKIKSRKVVSRCGR